LLLLLLLLLLLFQAAKPLHTHTQAGQQTWTSCISSLRHSSMLSKPKLSRNPMMICWAVPRHSWLLMDSKTPFQ
jgi:hypothetical protein